MLQELVNVVEVACALLWSSTANRDSHLKLESLVQSVALLVACVSVCLNDLH